MIKSDMADRTQAFALAVIRLYTSLPRSTTAQVIGRQLLRSGTSVGANYREARRSRSPAEYVSKIETALQELDETDYWLQLLVGADILKPERIAGLRKEADELLAILVTCSRKAKYSIQRPSR
jgi:four helix bundle protein